MTSKNQIHDFQMKEKLRDTEEGRERYIDEERQTERERERERESASR